MNCRKKNYSNLKTKMIKNKLNDDKRSGGQKNSPMWFPKKEILRNL